MAGAIGGKVKNHNNNRFMICCSVDKMAVKRLLAGFALISIAERVLATADHGASMLLPVCSKILCEYEFVNKWS